MKREEPTSLSPVHEQVYLIERDCGLLARVLGLYAARGLDILHVDYAHAAQSVMKLSVRVADASAEAQDTLRVLVDKAAGFVGVIAAEQLHAAPSMARATVDVI